MLLYISFLFSVINPSLNMGSHPSSKIASLHIYLVFFLNLLLKNGKIKKKPQTVSILLIYFSEKIKPRVSVYMSGVQPGFFQNKGGFLDKGYFDKNISISSITRQRKVLQGKFLEFFLGDTLQTAF